MGTSNKSDIVNKDWCNDAVCPATVETILPIYYVALPLYFCGAICANSFILRCLYRLTKKRSGYFYQLALAISETVEVCFVVFSMLMLYCTPPTTAYWWAFISDKVGYFLTDFAVQNTMVVSLLNAMDRLFSMALPLKYKQLSSRVVRRTVVSCCVCASIVLNTDNFVAYTVECSDDGRSCSATQNADYKGSLTDTVVSIVRISLLAVGLLTLIGSNAAMLRLYRRRVQKVAQMTTENDAKNAARKREEAILVTLTASQSLFVMLNVGAALIYYCVFRINCIDSCEMSILLVVLHLLYMLVKLMNVVLCIMINKIFREQLSNDFDRCCSTRIICIVSQALGSRRGMDATSLQVHGSASRALDS